MSEPKLITPLLADHLMGDPISNHHGVQCCPALHKETQGKYIVKILSIPATSVQLDALLLSGAFSNKESALEYFKELSDGIVQEAEVLRKLSSIEGFCGYEGGKSFLRMTQTVTMSIYWAPTVPLSNVFIAVSL